MLYTDTTVPIYRAVFILLHFMFIFCFLKLYNVVRYHMVFRRILCTEYKNEIFTALYVPNSLVWSLITIF